MELEDTLFHSGCQKVSYLNFKPFTHMADYLHSPIIAKSEKKKKKSKDYPHWWMTCTLKAKKNLTCTKTI